MHSSLVEVEAVELRKRSTARSQHPTFYVVAETPDGARHDVVVKPGLTDMTYFKEWLGAELARCLGISVPDSFAVSISSPFVMALRDTHREFETNSIIYGAREFTGFTAPRHPLPDGAQHAARRLLIFDVLTQNADRREATPNFVVRGDDVLAFDHEAIGSDLDLVIPQDLLGIVRDHWVARELKQRDLFIAFSDWVTSLTDEAIDTAMETGVALWPWRDATKIAKTVKQRRDSATEWLARMHLCL